MLSMYGGMSNSVRTLKKNHSLAFRENNRKAKVTVIQMVIESCILEAPFYRVY
jgi:hypothetical protein